MSAKGETVNCNGSSPQCHRILTQGGSQCRVLYLLEEVTVGIVKVAGEQCLHCRRVGLLTWVQGFTRNELVHHLTNQGRQIGQPFGEEFPFEHRFAVFEETIVELVLVLHLMIRQNECTKVTIITLQREIQCYKLKVNPVWLPGFTFLRKLCAEDGGSGWLPPISLTFSLSKPVASCLTN